MRACMCVRLMMCPLGVRIPDNRKSSDTGAHAPGGLEGEEREQWRRELGEARREANTLREELLHRREEAGRLKVCM